MDKNNKELIKEKVTDAIKILEEVCEVLLESDAISPKSYSLSKLVSEFTINPQYGQITSESCFIIEDYYYMPNRIYTPIGYICIPCRIYNVSKNTIEKVHDMLEQRLYMQLYKQPEKTTVGLIGGWFKIGETEPIFKERSEYIGYLESYDIFEKCLKKYLLNNHSN